MVIVLEAQKEFKLRQKEELILEWDYNIDCINLHMEKLRELYEKLLDKE